MKHVPREQLRSSPRVHPRSFVPVLSADLRSSTDSRLGRAGNSLALTFNRHLTFSLLRVSGDGRNEGQRGSKPIYRFGHGTQWPIFRKPSVDTVGISICFEILDSSLRSTLRSFCRHLTNFFHKIFASLKFSFKNSRSTNFPIIVLESHVRCTIFSKMRFEHN